MGLFTKKKVAASILPQPKKKDTIVSFHIAVKLIRGREMVQAGNVAVIPEVGDWVLFEKVEKEAIKPGVSESKTVASFRARCTLVSATGWGYFETWASEVEGKISIHRGEVFTSNLYLRKIIPQ